MNTTQAALNAFNNQQYTECLAHCEQGLARNATDSNLLQLKGLSLSQLGHTDQALPALDRALSMQPDTLQFFLNYSDLLVKIGSYKDAEKLFVAYENRLQKHEAFWFRYGLLLKQLFRFDEAFYCFEKCCLSTFSANHFKAITDTAIKAKRYQDAQKFIDKARTTLSDQELIIRYFEFELARAKNDNTNAEHIANDIWQQYQTPQSLHSLGLTKIESGDYQSAISLFERVVDLQPTNIEAHRRLNELYYNHQTDAFGASYQAAIKKSPSTPTLYHNLASDYASREDLQAAQHWLEQGVNKCGATPELLHGLASIFIRQGNIDQGREILDSLVQWRPNTRWLIDRANIDIRQENFTAAEQYLAHANALSPDDQEVWGYLGLVWRETNVEKYRWLMQYENLMAMHQHDAPTGFSSANQFFDELSGALRALHTTSNEPLDQSVRQGTQTIGNLFAETNELIQLFEGLVSTAIDDYLRRQTRDTKHPFLRHVTDQTHLSGAWSILLNDHGFHQPHLHPKGWLSCCNYIQLPESTLNNEGGKIYFGKSSVEYAANRADHVIQPQRGSVVFFPSYYWHGTTPIMQGESRMTVPCDINPKFR